MTKTCTQCGAILATQVRICTFCDSTLLIRTSSADDAPAAKSGSAPADGASHSAWRNEVSRRLESYRARRRKLSADESQSQLPFEQEILSTAAIAVDEQHEVPATAGEGFSFTLAIGRCAGSRPGEDGQFLIDVSAPPETPEEAAGIAVAPVAVAEQGQYPVAPIEERRLAALVDGVCLAFACGGFLALFGSLGGQFTLSKLSAAVYTTAFAIVYLQYFFLFTVFGGTTPGMMVRRLKVTALSGEEPTPRQLLLRATGYVLSAGTFFLGFLWAMWDEDALTWHDRMSRTCLSTAETLADAEHQAILHQH